MLNDISEKEFFLSQNIYVDFVENHNNYNNNIVSDLNNNYFNNLTLNYTNERFKLSYNYSYDKEYYFLFSEKIANNMYKNNAFINPFIAMNGESHSLHYKHKIFDNVFYSLFIEKQIPYEYYTDNFNQKMSYLVSTKLNLPVIKIYLRLSMDFLMNQHLLLEQSLQGHLILKNQKQIF